MGIQVVWFKRDLRIRDHAPLARAARAGPVLGVYVFEPSLLDKVTTDPSHVQFILQSLAELRAAMAERGGALWVLRGELPETFDRLFEALRFEALWSHEETGDLATYARDRRVKRWSRARRLPWTELPQNGVVRGPHDRDAWARTWQSRAATPAVEPPDELAPLSPELDGISLGPTVRCWRGSTPLPSPAELGVPASRKTEAQLGGESEARATLKSFLYARGRSYRADMSSPVTSWDGCSRLSPYIAYGNVSIRQVHHASRRRLSELRHGFGARGSVDRAWLDSLKSFESRLRWHCHFMQKLEDEPEIEVRNMNRAFDGLRTEDPEEWTPEERAAFDAWCAGRTGYPLVDAVMRALHAGGWINFRMRAMLVSFAAHHLWLHWLPLARYLARHFLDYEPGIHFSQFQMQSGTTGINTTRIYNPVKQVADQDPDGAFIRAYVPELRHVPAAHIAEPRRMPRAVADRAGCVIGRDYPAPIVDHAAAYRLASERLIERKRSTEARRESLGVLHRHGSRRRPPRR